MAEQKVDKNSPFYVSPIRPGQQINISNNVLPQIAFSHSQRALFPTKAKSKRWYNNINYHYSSRFTNNQKYFYETESTTQDDGTMGYEWVLDSDASAKEKTFSDYIISHTSGMNMSSKVFKYFNITDAYKN